MKEYHKVNFTLVSGKLTILAVQETFSPLFSSYENNRNYLFFHKI